jgi:DNA-binding SARP family transcriptional activator/Tfp pilus assembly protein PilF
MFSLKVLGGLSLDSDNGPLPPGARQKRRVGLLAILAIAGARGASRERVQVYLYPESSSARARHALDQLLYATRQALGVEPFLSTGGEICLDPNVVRSDVGRFDDAIRSNSWTDAAALYGGPLLDGVHLSDSGELEMWIDGERARLQGEYQKTLETLARTASAAGDSINAIEWWRKLALSDSLSSRVATETIQALARANEHAAAIHFARTFQQRIRSELGVEPDVAIQTLVDGLASKAVAIAESASAQGGRSASRLTSVAVPPFVFLGEAENSRALSLGFADALITIFGNLEDLVVAPTSAILHYAAGSDPARVCRDLAVSHALQGTVQQLGSRWRVSVQLFDAATRKITLSEKHDFTMDSMFEVQDAIGRRVVESLQRRFPLTVPKSRDRYTRDPKAYDEFMAGLSESYSGKQDELRSASAHLLTAIERDPEFALAHATLSMVSMDMHFHFDPQRTWLNRAEDHCRRALALDPTLAEAHMARAWILWSPAKGFQHAEAIAALEQVLAARPNLERAHNRMASICGHIGRLPEARLAHERAGRLNPRTRSGNLEWNYIYSGDFARADDAVEGWFRDRPENLYALYTRILPPLSSGNLEIAEQRLSAALAHSPDEPLLVTLQAILHARRNEPALALDCVRRALDSPHSFGHTHHTHYQIACVYAVLGETDTAIAWLERSVASGFACWPFFRLDPHLESLRAEPAFERLVAELETTYGGLQISRL